MNKLILDPNNTLRHLQVQLTAELQQAAEPLIRKAIEDYEKEVRRRMSVAVIALIEHSFQVESYRDELVIKVLHRTVDGGR